MPITTARCDKTFEGERCGAVATTQVHLRELGIAGAQQVRVMCTDCAEFVRDMAPVFATAAELRPLPAA